MIPGGTNRRGLEVSWLDCPAECAACEAVSEQHARSKEKTVAPIALIKLQTGKNSWWATRLCAACLVHLRSLIDEAEYAIPASTQVHEDTPIDSVEVPGTV